MPDCYSHLSMKDRRQLFELLEAKVPVKEIAQRLNRHRSTIYREIKRNWFHDPDWSWLNGYTPVVAQNMSLKRRPVFWEWASASFGVILLCAMPSSIT